MKLKSNAVQLESEKDRTVLREYLTRRLRMLRRARKRAGEAEEAAFYDGGLTEMELAFDELLREEPPDLRKKAVAQ